MEALSLMVNHVDSTCQTRGAFINEPLLRVVWFIFTEIFLSVKVMFTVGKFIKLQKSIKKKKNSAFHSPELYLLTFWYITIQSFYLFPQIWVLLFIQSCAIL